MAAMRVIVAGVTQVPHCIASAAVRGVASKQALSSASSLTLRAAPLLSAFAKSFSSAVSRRQIHSCKVVPAEYTVNEDGEEATLEFRVFFSDKSGKTLKSFVKIFPGVKHGWTVRYDEHDEHAVEEANEAHTLMIDWFAKYL